MILTRPTLGLSAVSLGFFVLALVATLTSEHGAVNVEGEGEVFLPQFQDEIPDFSKITITAADGTTTLNRRDGIWRVGEKNNYPADGFRVQLLLGALSKSLKIEPRTSDPAYFDRLGLGDAARTVSFESQGGEPIVSLQLGDQYMSPAGLGVLTFSWDQESGRVWSVSQFPEVSPDPTFWVEANVLNLSQQRVKRATLMLVGGEALAFERQTPDSANFFPLQPMGGVFNQEAINDLGFALTDIFLEDIAPAATGELFHVADAKFETFDGLVIDISFFDAEGVVWTTFAASYNEAALEEEESLIVFPDAPVDGAAEAAALNVLWGGYIYQIPIEQLTNILKRKQDLVR